MNTAVPNFTTRVLMSVREDVVHLLETAERIRAQFDAMAKENGVMPIKQECARRTART